MQEHLREEPSPGAPGPETANPGLVRPPLVFLGSIIIGLVLHLIWPMRFAPPSFSTPAGVGIALLGVAFFVGSIRALQVAGTPVPGNRPTTTIVWAGPYRISRNPIYLAFSLFQLGLAVWINSVAMLITLVPAVALMSFVVIPREERYLEAHFPTEYLSYKASVRRWL